jgi:hypothetical protein
VKAPDAQRQAIRQGVTTIAVLLLLALAWRLIVPRSPSPADLGKSHANNTTTVHYKNGVTCYYHQEWRQMSCVYSNETYGPKEY